MPNDSEREFRESERRLIQKELFLLEDQKDAAEQRFRAMFENALVGLFRADVRAAELTDANLEAAQIFGFDTVEELLWWVNVESDEFAYFHTIPSPGSLDTGKPYSFSARSRRRDGTEFWAQFSVRYTGDGRWLEGAIKDITDQVESTDRLKQAKAEAEEANEAKSRFLATMSHEIRTPLNGIIGFAEILQERNDPKSREYSRKILDESDRLMILINQLLDFSRLEANKITLESILLDLHQLVDEIDASFVEVYERAGLTYQRYIDPQLPRWYVGDPMRLRQVITNLLSNAIKFTHKGGISLRIEKAGEDSDSPLVSFSVKDTGIGIPEEKQKSIFSSFVQADSSISRRYGGTGLGISICQELIALMGGKLELDSREGEGSDFHFVVPMSLPPDTVKAKPAFLNNPLRQIERLSGITALIVEDYDTNREIARHHLENAGCEILIAQDGVMALDLFEAGTDVDIVFMDMHMPRMDGLEATRELRNRGIDIPIIGMTASAYAEDRIRCLDSGMDDFLTKPLRRAVLLAKAVDWITIGGFASKRETEVLENLQALSGDSSLRYNDFLDELDGETDLARELLDGFYDDSCKRLEHALEALNPVDYEVYHREMHSIKGGAMNVMADELAARAYEAENLGREEAPVSELESALSAVDGACNRFIEAWKGIQDKNEARKRQPGTL